MATPHVAALYLDDNPNTIPVQVQAAMESIADVNKVSDARSDSLNLLLNNNFGGSANTRRSSF